MKKATIRKKNTLRSIIEKWLKQLLTPIMREVISEREKEISDTIRRVAPRQHHTDL